ncbi:phosphotransferase family protein [Plantactinospora sp. WMMB334]|uniref:phosphotransferase family protein n=1 Tax=Plantactinospora sp. WMMB334 TaxID=3404119 RepID=UPI003B94E356
MSSSGNERPDSVGAGWPEKILRKACDKVGLNPADARLIKFTNNAVFDLASDAVVVRIPGSQVVRDRVDKVVAVARWLESHQMPSVRLLTDIAQPLLVGGHKVTFWRRVPATGPAPTGYDLGRILRRYHSLPEPPPALPVWSPTTAIQQRIEETDNISPSERAFLEDKCHETEANLNRLDYFLPRGPIHGDSFIGNLIPDPQGPVVCDFDSAAVGPREWDLTPVAVGKLRFSYSQDTHQQLAEAYGVNILDWSGFAVLRTLRELQLVTSVLPVLHTNPSLTEQWRHRFKTFRDGDDAATWSPYK